MYDYSKHRTIMHPHNPQWSFVQSKCCERYEESFYKCDREIWPGEPEDYKCEEQCIKCKTICEFNDYIRGVKPMNKPNYPVPAIPHRFQWYWMFHDNAYRMSLRMTWGFRANRFRQWFSRDPVLNEPVHMGWSRKPYRS